MESMGVGANLKMLGKRTLPRVSMDCLTHNGRIL